MLTPVCRYPMQYPQELIPVAIEIECESQAAGVPRCGAEGQVHEPWRLFGAKCAGGKFVVQVSGLSLHQRVGGK